MFSKKPQVIRFDQNLCNAKVDDNEVLFVRVTGVVDDKNALFEVPPTHSAYVIKGGGDERFYKSGTYEVFDNKKEVKAWKKGLSVDIIYIPNTPSVKVLWGTAEKFKYRDEASNKVVNVGARGYIFVTITNFLQFYKKIVGNKKEFDLKEFKKNFSGNVVNYFADYFLKVVKAEKLTYDQFDAYKLEIGEKVGKLISEKFEQDWGIGITNFVIEWVGIDGEDSTAVENAAAEVQKQKKLKEYLDELERLEDKKWEREKYLRQLELQDKQAYYEVLKIVGHPPVGSGATASGTAATYCPHCGAKAEGGDIFCSKCGTRIVKETVTCPKCGKANDGDAAFCSVCGTKLK